MTDKFIFDYIALKEQQNSEFIRYSYYELKVKNNLNDEEIDKFLRVNRDYFENHGYKVYFTGARFTYKNTNILVQDNQLMIAVKDDEKDELI